MANKKIKRKRRPSLLWSAVDRFTAMIYSFFVGGRVGDMLSSNDTLCKRSFLANVLKQKKATAGKTLLKYPETLMEKSAMSRAIVFVRVFFSSLKLNVYGVFLAFFGMTSAIVSLIPAMTGGMSAISERALITSAIITVCSIPLLFSSQSGAEAIYKSKIMGKIAIDVLCIPEEKFKIKKQYGGTAYAFTSSIAAMILGCLSYFSDPLYVPIAMICVFALFLVFSSPESGVIITLALTPFLQYFENSRSLLLVMIVVTSISYFCKVFQRRRGLSLSPEISMVILFCGFIVTGVLFSHCCVEILLDSLYVIVVILGGFFLTYNLVNSEKLLSAAFKALTYSFIALCIMGIWESVYYGLSNRIMDSVNPHISHLTEEKILYLEDNGIIFGIFAVLMFPMLFAYLSRQRSARRIALILSCCVLAIITAWMRSHYEIMIALLIECLVYWLIYSHKTLTAAVFAAIPISIAAILYPYAITYLNWPDVFEIIFEYMPARIVDSDMHPSVISDVLAMIGDGNHSGIGAGEHAFLSVFPHYASASSVGAKNPMSLWLEILCWSGIFGLVSFIIFVVFLLKRSAGYLIDQRSKALRARALSLFSGLVAAMLLGCVYSIWTDERVLYLFWAFTGLLMGYIRLGQERDELRRTEFENVENEKDVELVFYE